MTKDQARDVLLASHGLAFLNLTFDSCIQRQDVAIASI